MRSCLLYSGAITSLGWNGTMSPWTRSQNKWAGNGVLNEQSSLNWVAKKPINTTQHKSLKKAESVVVITIIWQQHSDTGGSEKPAGKSWKLKSLTYRLTYSQFSIRLWLHNYRFPKTLHKSTRFKNRAERDTLWLGWVVETLRDQTMITKDWWVREMLYDHDRTNNVTGMVCEN